MINTRFIGRLGEQLVADYLQKQGYKILCKNFRCKLGEIDLIAREGKDLVFVEVKSRSNYSYGLPQESVHQKKQLKLRQVAAYFIQKNGCMDSRCRFDVVAVTFSKEPEQVASIEIIKNAF